MDKQWGNVQESKEQGEAITYIFEKNNMSVVYPFIKREAGVIDGVRYFDLVTPRGECGPWTEKNEKGDKLNLLKEFDRAFDKYCSSNNIVAEYIRFNPWIDESASFSNIYNTKFYGSIFCNDLTCDFFKNEYKSSKRRAVRKAQKSNVEIVFDTEYHAIEDFLSLYTFTESKYELSDYYLLDRQFLEGYERLIPNKTVYVKALYKEKIIASALILLGEDIAHYHFAANHPDYSSFQANSLLIYQAALFAAKQGKKLFDLGCAKKGSELERFKSGFTHGSDKEYSCSVGTKIRNFRIYEKLVAKAGGPKANYFPEYRR